MHLSDILVTLLFGYPVPAEMVDPRFPLFLQRSSGLVLTLLITVLSLILGACLGTALALCRRETAEDARTHILDRLLDRAFRAAAAALVEGIRGLPIMLLVLLTFHLPYRLFELRVPSFVLAVAGFSLYAGVYLSESMRAGFRSVDSGLRQVGQMLGLTPRQILVKIELPLIGRTMLPDVINLAITVFKDTSTLAIVAVPELTYVGRQMAMSEPVNYGLVLFSIMLLYWLPATVLSTLALRVEQHQESLTGPLHSGTLGLRRH